GVGALRLRIPLSLPAQSEVERDTLVQVDAILREGRAFLTCAAVDQISRIERRDRLPVAADCAGQIIRQAGEVITTEGIALALLPEMRHVHVPSEPDLMTARDPRQVLRNLFAARVEPSWAPRIATQRAESSDHDLRLQGVGIFKAIVCCHLKAHVA